MKIEFTYCKQSKKQEEQTKNKIIALLAVQNTLNLDKLNGIS